MLHTKYQSSMPSSFREKDFQRFCYFFPFGCHGNQLWLEFNLLNNFGRASPKENPCQVSSRLAQLFRRRRCLNKCTTDIGRSQKLTMSTLCSGELKSWSPAFYPFPTMFSTLPKTNFNFFFTLSRLNEPEKDAFENLLMTSIFSFSNNVCYFSQSKFRFFSYMYFSVTYILSYANVFNLDQSKIVLFG